ncbi:MAG: response regulator, partial [Deltaproteobacteria bacterium]|nr:response regulator [Deltaproteobacteria bacterium]
QVLFVFSAQDEVELQVQQARRMEAIGGLAGGVAHDFNNLLTVMTGNVDFLRSTFERPDVDVATNLGVLDEMDVACDRAAQLVSQLMRFASPAPQGPAVTIDAGRVIDDATALCSRTVGGDIELSVDTDSDLMVRADPGQIQQIVVEICVNGRDAMPEGGRLEVKAFNVRVENPEPLVPPGDYVKITVSDTGRGMSEEIRERVFDPFFSTKPRDRGTGLGLARVYTTVRELGGRIGVESVENEGTTFEVYLPQVQMRVIPETRPLPEGALDFELPAGIRQVLLVDDEVQVRRAVGRLLEHLGFEITHASDGHEALELTTSAKTFDLWMLDIQMPRMDGHAALRELRARGFDTPVLVTSGGLDAREIAALPGEGANGFLAKPARLRDLQEAIASVFREETMGAEG